MDTLQTFFNICYPQIKTLGGAWDNPHTLSTDDFDAKGAMDAFEKLSKGERTEILKQAMGKHLAYRKSNVTAGAKSKVLRVLGKDPEAIKALVARGVITEVDAALFRK